MSFPEHRECQVRRPSAVASKSFVETVPLTSPESRHSTLPSGRFSKGPNLHGGILFYGKYQGLAIDWEGRMQGKGQHTSVDLDVAKGREDPRGVAGIP